MKKGMMSLVVLVVLVGFLAGCGSTPEVKMSHLEELRQRGFAYLGFFQEPPWAYVDENGDFKGADVDVARAVMKCAGIAEVRPVPTRWEGLIPGLQAKRYDVITTGMIVTAEREAAMIHSQPTWRFTSIGLVAKGNPKGIHSLQDVKEKGATMAYVTGGYEGEWAKEAGIPDDQVLTFLEHTDMVQALSDGRIDLAYTAELSQRRHLSARPELADKIEIVEDWVYPEIVFTGHWFHPDDVELRDAYNECLTQLKNDGTVEKLAEQNDFPPELMMPVPEQ